MGNKGWILEDLGLRMNMIKIQCRNSQSVNKNIIFKKEMENIQ